MDASPADADLLGNVRACMRPDLRVTLQDHGGASTYILKDPVGLRYTQLRTEEFFLLSSLDGTQSLDEVQRLFAQRFAPRRIPLSELVAEAEILHKSKKRGDKTI